MTANTHYYEILEIPSDADEREIKRAYHRLARELHPDKASSPDEAREYEERFALVSAAYNTLKDKTKREQYDRGLKKDAEAARPSATSRVLSAGRNRPGAAGTATGGTSARSTMKSQGQKSANIGITPERVSIAQKAYARGLQCMKEGNLAKAISFFEAAIQNNDQEAHYHSKLGLVLIKEHKSATRAIQAAQRACDLDPYNMEHKFTLAYIYETIGSESNARRLYEEIRKWDGDNMRAKAALAALDKKKKKGPFGLGGGASTESGPKAASGGFLQGLLDRFLK